MSSAYGVISRPATARLDELENLLPSLKTTLKNGKTAILSKVDANNAHHINVLRELLNSEIIDGRTYPQEYPLNQEEFKAYFLSYDAFVLLSNDEITGTFYVKPNFPGRCSHICNGGFITHPNYRNQGVGTFLADCFIKIAPLLGYRASMFNLVFANNVASIATWKKRGFKELGRVPQAGRLNKYQDGVLVGEEYIDAIMFGYQFVE